MRFGRFRSFPLAVALCVWASACEPPPPQVSAIRDLIQPVELIAGKSDTLLLSDLFYAEDYAVEFEPHPLIRASVDSSTRKLALAASDSAAGLILLGFRHGNGSYKLPVFVKRLQKVAFAYEPKPSDKRVFLMGSFNGWHRSNLPMDLVGGRFERALELDAGRYEYKFVVDGKEIIDENNPVKLPNGFGGYNSVVEVQSPAKRTYLHVIEARVRNDITELHFVYEGDSTRILASDIIALQDNQAIPPQQFQIVENRVVIRLKQRDLVGEKVVRVAISKGGVATPIQTVFLINGRPKGSNKIMPFASKAMVNEWNWRDATIYSIMIDRFANGDSSNDRPVKHDSLFAPANWRGGDLKGIIQKLDEGYFDSLGANVLWLSPVNRSTDKAFREYPPPHRYYAGYHGYWSTHHEAVDSRFGSMDDLKRLVAKAHSRRMKVLLDFVANHVHIEHPFFQQRPDWFGTLDLPDGRKNLRLWDEYRLTTWFEPYLPSFDYSKPEPRAAMTDNAIWWLKQTGIDGFRHDAVKHIPNEFWRELTRKIKSQIEIPERRKLYQIGETFGGYDLIKSYVNNGQLDAQFNFNLYDVAVYAFASPQGDFRALATELERTHRIYGTSHVMGNIMDSHDKVRFPALAEGDIRFDENAAERAWKNPPEINDKKTFEKVKLYQAYLHTIPGVPVIYYGDEIAMTGAADPDNRRLMRFGKDVSDDEKAVFAETSRLVKLRQAHSALRYGDFQILHSSKDALAYLRSDMNERVLVALNKGEAAQAIAVKFPSFYYAKKLRDLQTGEEIALANDEATIRLASLQAKILKVE
ncbi:MAG: alpha-amylase family glycosyl hydrolase [Chloroherpetonaceae bacterium]|nr:alpha-amylase family glycosyl hydrolase [Chloroherpetonaceae bacterium]MDW8437623.1 alpha-amylase family glycosyl hydrolase [Chloroherpetonaceae bacterium]